MQRGTKVLFQSKMTSILLCLLEKSEIGTKKKQENIWKLRFHSVLIDLVEIARKRKRKAVPKKKE